MYTTARSEGSIELVRHVLTDEHHAGETPADERLAGGTPADERLADGTPADERLAGGTPADERLVLLQRRRQCACSTASSLRWARATSSTRARAPRAASPASSWRRTWRTSVRSSPAAASSSSPLASAASSVRVSDYRLTVLPRLSG